MGRYTDLLERGLSAMQLSLSEEQLQQLERYVSEIELFNPTYKLVGATGEALIVDHIFDSLVAVPTIKALLDPLENPQIADLGSGAGLPGIPLAIALRETHVSLVERMQRRVNFLRSAVVATELTDRVTIIDRDLTEVEGTFDLITFRALHPLVDILDSVAPLLSVSLEQNYTINPSPRFSWEDVLVFWGVSSSKRSPVHSLLGHRNQRLHKYPAACQRKG